VEAKDDAAYDGKAAREWIRLSSMTPRGMCSFPFQLLLPKTKDPAPAFVHIAFQQRAQSALRPAGLDEHMPAEEILDAGYAVANLFYEDATSDTPERDGLARAYPQGRAGSWGQIWMWAFAASRRNMPGRKYDTRAACGHCQSIAQINGAVMEVLACGWRSKVYSDDFFSIYKKK
jgi:hypothetical protein